MSPLHILSAADQVAAHLRSEILRGTWTDYMPGGDFLTRQLGAGRNTIEAGLQILEKEGFLVSQGAGRRRRIALPENIKPPGLRVAVLLYESASLASYDFSEIRHKLSDAGHSVVFAPKTLMDLRMDARKVAQMVEKTPADAWIISSASSEILSWFEQQQLAAIAYAGQFPDNMKMASVGPSRKDAMIQLVRRLVAFGHRRIVYLSRSKAHPTSFFREIEAHGIPLGPYNNQHLSGDPNGLKQCIDALFSITPPTALFIDEASIFIAVQNQLARRGIFAPENVSLACTDPDPTFEYIQPKITHMHWSYDRLVQKIIEWVESVSLKKEKKQAYSINAELIEGETIGPAPV